MFLFKKKDKKKKTDSYVSSVAAENGITYPAAEKAMERAKEQFGISYASFAKKHLWGCSDKELEAVAAKLERIRQKHIDTIISATGQSEEEVVKKFEEISGTHHVSLKAYTQRGYFSLTGDEIAADLKKRKEENAERIRSIAEASGLSEKEVKSVLKECNVKYGLTSEQYLAHECWKMTDEELAALRKTLRTSKKPKKKKPSKKNTNRLVSSAAEVFGISYEEAFEDMNRVKEEYGIQYYTYIKSRLYGASDETLARTKKKLENKRRIFLSKMVHMSGKSEEELLERFEQVHAKYGVTLQKYCNYGLFLLSDDEIAEKIAEENAEKAQELEYIVKESGWTMNQVRIHMKRCDTVYGIDSSHYMIFRAWELSDEQLASYLTIDTSTALRKKYSDVNLNRLDNKKLFNGLFGEYIKRKYWINTDTSLEEYLEFIDGLDMCIKKPINGTTGRGVVKYNLDHENPKAQYEALIADEPLVLEEFVIQHDEMNRLYDGCVNTCRIISILKDDQVYVPCAILKIGNGGSAADNLIRGGVGVGIDEKTGILVTDAVDVKGNVYECHPTSGVKVKGFQIPYWDEILKMMDGAMRVLPEVGYAGWDVAIGKDGPVIIEGNGRPDLGLCQIPFAYLHEGIKYKFDDFI